MPSATDYLPEIISGIPAVGRGLLGLYQLTQHVNRVDTTTPAEREALATARQQATAQLPYYGMRLGQLARIQANTLQNAQLGAGSASDLLAAGTAASQQRQAGEQALGQQDEQYRDVATRQLQAQLAKQAAHQQADTDRANQANAQLESAGLSNLYGGIVDAATVGVGALAKAGIGAATAGASRAAPDENPYGLYKRRSGGLYGTRVY